jgi:hypothetical protein
MTRKSAANPNEGNQSARLEGSKKNLSVSNVYVKSSSEMRVLTVNLGGD